MGKNIIVYRKQKTQVQHVGLTLGGSADFSPVRI